MQPRRGFGWPGDSRNVRPMQEGSRRVAVTARAKVNLVLDIGGIRDDGYHEIRSVMQSVSLADTVTVSVEHAPAPPSGGAIEVTSSCPHVPLGPSNTAWKAAAVLLDCAGLVDRGLRVWVHIEKKIPMGAGLAGGSADAAATLTGLSHVLGLGLSLFDLRELGARVGADVPFCIAGGTHVVQGKGDVLLGLARSPSFWVVIVKPPVSVSTAWAYRAYDESWPKPVQGTEALLNMAGAIGRGDVRAIAKSLFNGFEGPVLREFPDIARAKQLALDSGALGAVMTGSGSAVIGVFEGRAAAVQAAEEIRGRSGWFVEACSTENEGCTVVNSTMEG